MTETWIMDVNKRDGRLLVSWWNAHDLGHIYWLRKRDSGKLHDVRRYPMET